MSAWGHSRPFSPVVIPQTYHNVAPLLVSISILGFLLGLTDYASVFEATVVSRLLRFEVAQMSIYEPTTEPLVSYFQVTLTDPRSYLVVGYFFVSLFVGISTFLFVFVVASLGIASLLHRSESADSALDSGLVTSVDWPEINTNPSDISPSPTIKTVSDCSPVPVSSSPDHPSAPLYAP